MTKEKLKQAVIGTHPDKRHIWRDCEERRGTWAEKNISEEEWKEWLEAPAPRLWV